MSEEVIYDQETLRKKPGLLNDATYTPSLTRKPSSSKTAVPSGPAPKLGSIKRDKFSSTATMFLESNNSCLVPRVFDILCCISTAIHNALVLNKEKPSPTPSIWSEQAHPLGARHDLTEIPPHATINKFLTEIWDGQKLSAECAVMTIAYVDRFVALTGNQIQNDNWRRIVLAAAIVASKVWEDLAVWNADFLTIFPEMSVTDLNCLEREMLTALQFVVSLKASLYAHVITALPHVSLDSDLPMKALSQAECARLESKSQSSEEGFKVIAKAAAKNKSKSDSTLLDGAQTAHLQSLLKTPK